MASDLAGTEFDEYLGEVERSDYDGVVSTSLYECRICFAVVARPERHHVAAHSEP